jgi:hypothetical protein
VSRPPLLPPAPARPSARPAGRPQPHPRAPATWLCLPRPRRYVADAKELQKYAAAVHLLPELPDAIAVHNLAAMVQVTRWAASPVQSSPAQRRRGSSLGSGLGPRGRRSPLLR